jgi:hypothetical protein
MFDGYKGRVQPGQQSMENCQIFSDNGYDGEFQIRRPVLLYFCGHLVEIFSQDLSKMGDLEPRKWRFDREKMEDLSLKNEEWSVKTMIRVLECKQGI